jgi:hypothetical protein
MANMTLGSPEPVRFGVKILSDLRRKLTESKGDEAENPRLRLWAFYVGSLAENVHPVRAGEEGWFTVEYDMQAASLGAADWEDARRVMKLFLHSDRLHTEIESGRAHRVADIRQGLYAASGCSWREPFLEPGFVESTGEGTVAAGKQRAP